MILSKVYDPNDLELQTPLGDMHVAPLFEELKLVDAHWDESQHVSRRWEYAMALKARRTWLQWDYETHGHANRAHGHRIVDVGGHNSPFRGMIGDDAGQPIIVVDPASASGLTLEQHLRFRGGLAHEVYCISVIEHVDDLNQFLYHLSCLVAPGGLLFLTTDFWDKSGPDQAHWHWMRKRIFNEESLGRLIWGGYETTVAFHDFNLLGEVDWRFRVPIENWGYAPASLALVKRV